MRLEREKTSRCFLHKSENCTGNKNSEKENRKEEGREDDDKEIAR